MREVRTDIRKWSSFTEFEMKLTYSNKIMEPQYAMYVIS